MGAASRIARAGAAALALSWGLAWAGSAAADVLQIGPGGAVTVYSAPTVFTAQGAAPIPRRPAIAPRAQAAAPAVVSRIIAEASQRFALPAPLMQAVAWQESRYHQGAVSNKGAIGVMQLMPGTARQLGVDPYDLRQNIHGGAAYLSQMLARYRGDTSLALAAYNAGPGAVDRHGGAPPYKETGRYISGIIQRTGATVAAAGSSPLIFGQ
jgi:soluble lytic murein transglycosylase-like protein